MHAKGPAMVTARYREARWALLGAQARLDVVMATYREQPTEALLLWKDICEMRREHYRLEQSST
jgi:hypothetical protein